jgi:hypothetical protein
MDIVTDDVWGFATTATIIPFSIFTSMFHQCFKKYRFLESTLELIQQFYLQTDSIAQDYKLFSGDLLKFYLKCLRCEKRITPFEILGKILFMAQMAISHHLKILLSVSVVNDSPMIFKNMPVLFTMARNYSASEESFDESFFETAGDDKVLFFSKNICTSHDSRIGEYSFCEAVKVDVAESEVKYCKNQLSSRKNQISSTVSLLCISFENLGCAIKLHKECANNVTEQRSLDTRKYLFNGQEERDDCNYFLFGQGIINDFNGAEKEYLKLYESWCLCVNK